jgi:asparagine synthase (glutamine-hydrolysing)
MCGIFICHNRKGDIAAFRPRAVALSKKLRHRGPDWSGCYQTDDTIMCHERLAIVGVGECSTVTGE